MLLGAAFDDFDPKKGSFVAPWESFNRIAQRARRILKGRRKKEIEYAALAISWMLNDHEVQAHIRQDSGTAGKIGELADMSPARILHTCISVVDIYSVKYFPNATWPEFLAVLSLALLGEAYRDTQGKFSYDKHVLSGIDVDKQGFSPQVRKFIRKPLDLALDAMEAVVLAEHLPQVNRLAARMSKEKISLRAAYAAMTKYEESNKVKRRFVDYCRANKFKNVNKAAAMFYQDELNDKDREALSHKEEVVDEVDRQDNAIRMLRETMYNMKKNE